MVETYKDAASDEPVGQHAWIESVTARRADGGNTTGLYNPYTGAYGATHQGSNAYSNWGSSTASKDGQTVDTQHYSSAAGN